MVGVVERLVGEARKDGGKDGQELLELVVVVRGMKYGLLSRF